MSTTELSRNSLTPEQKRLLHAIGWGGLVVLFGAGCLQFNAMETAKGRESLSYTKVPGTITFTNMAIQGRGSWSDCTVVYKYRIDGKEFTGDTISFSGTTTMDDAFKYRQGATVDVYYDPQHPAKCCLVPGVRSQHSQLMDWLSWIFTIGGFILMPIIYFATAKERFEK